MQVFDARAQLVAMAEQADNVSDNPVLNDNTDQLSTPSNNPDAAVKPMADVNVDADTFKNPPQSVDVDTYTASAQPSSLGDTGKKFKPLAKSIGKKSWRWLWTFASLILLLLAAMQCLYFLRNQIAIYYPDLKPYLIQACEKLHCSIDLPKKIDFVVIDDSDMQEDAGHAGLVRFASTLINHGNHVVAYPNLELTLTDIDDRPVIRRVFKPAEYLPAYARIEDGIAPGAETRIKLGIATQDIPVSGYRVFVTY